VQRGLTGKPQWERELTEKDPVSWPGVRLVPGGRCVVWSERWVVELDTAGSELRRSTAHQGLGLELLQFGPDGLLYSGKTGDNFAADGRTPLRRWAAWSGEAKGEMRLAGLLPSVHHDLNRWQLPTGDVFANVFDQDNQLRLARFNHRGRLVQTFRQHGTPVSGLPRGGVLATSSRRLIELSPEGRVVWVAVSRWPFGRADVVYPLLRFGFKRPADAKPLDLDSLEYHVKAMSDERLAARRWAVAQVSSAAWRGEVKESVMRALLHRLRDPDSEVRGIVLSMLVERHIIAGLPGERAAWDQAIPALIALLNSKNEGMSARWLLTRAGKNAIRPLLAAAKPTGAKAAWRRKNAVWALAWYGGAGDAEAAKVVRAALTDKDRALRLEAISGIDHTFSPQKSKVFLPDILRLADDADPEVALHAISSLRSLKEAGRQAVPALKRKLKDPKLRDMALSCLGDVGCRDEEAVRAIKEHSSRKHAISTCVTAIQALAHCGASDDVVATLIKAMEDERGNPKGMNAEVRPVRAAAMATLRQFKSGAKAAVPALLKVAENSKEQAWDRDLALRALDEIDKSAAEKARRVSKGN
jgi:HEAT repeat protein